MESPVDVVKSLSILGRTVRFVTITLSHPYTDNSVSKKIPDVYRHAPWAYMES